MTALKYWAKKLKTLNNNTRMDNYIEDAIAILMGINGYYWCEGCGKWVKESGREFHGCE